MTTEQVRSGLAATLMGVILVGLGLALVLEDPSTQVPPLPTQPVDREALEHKHQVDELIKQHDCWRLTEKAQVDIPSHAVVTTHSGLVLYVSVLGTTRALEDVFEGATNFRQVHAFCR